MKGLSENGIYTATYSCDFCCITVYIAGIQSFSNSPFKVETIVLKLETFEHSGRSLFFCLYRNSFLQLTLHPGSQNDFSSVSEGVHHSTQSNSCHYIKYGMLFNEHGG